MTRTRILKVTKEQFERLHSEHSGTLAFRRTGDDYYIYFMLLGGASEVAIRETLGLPDLTKS